MLARYRLQLGCLAALLPWPSRSDSPARAYSFPPPELRRETIPKRACLGFLLQRQFGRLALELATLFGRFAFLPAAMFRQCADLLATLFHGLPSLSSSAPFPFLPRVLTKEHPFAALAESPRAASG